MRRVVGVIRDLPEWPLNHLDGDPRISEVKSAYTEHVAERLEQLSGEESAPVDPQAVERAYYTHRARRQARREHTRRRKRAGIRFWVVLAALLAAGAFLVIVAWQEISRLFGL